MNAEQRIAPQIQTAGHQYGADDSQQQEEKIALLYQQIGQLQFELDWLKKKMAKLPG